MCVFFLLVSASLSGFALSLLYDNMCVGEHNDTHVQITVGSQKGPETASNDLCDNL